MDLFRNFFKRKENIIPLALALLMALTTFLLAESNDGLWPIRDRLAEKVPFLYFLCFTLLIFIAVSAYISDRRSNPDKIVARMLWAYSPSVIILSLELIHYAKLHYLVYLLLELFFVVLGIRFLARRKPWQKSEDEIPSYRKIKVWIKNQGKIIAFLVLLAIVLNFGFSLYHVAKFAAVDEPLWLFGRISGYWHSLENRDWKKTHVSDKPGVTVALVSGAGLLKINPLPFDTINWEGKVLKKNLNFESVYFPFRFPILLFAAMGLFFFYFFLEKLLGKRQAVISLIFIALSPILISMNRIVNADSLLWIFSGLAIISYLSYLKHRSYGFLYSSGIFLGLAIATKFTANILYVFFFALVFLEYIFRAEKYAIINLPKYLKRSLADYFIMSAISIAVFIILCPAVWIKPVYILTATIHSPALGPVWPLFAAIIGLVLADTIIIKNRLLSPIIAFLSERKKIIILALLSIFLLFVLIVMANVYGLINFTNFEEVLASPKSANKITADWDIFHSDIFLANFYPLVFGISPIALMAIILGILMVAIKERNRLERYYEAVYLIFFILLYYLGSTVTGVASTIRYQIILYPIIFIIAGIFLDDISQKMKLRFRLFALLCVILITAGSYSLVKISPLYSGYASVFLPQKYFLDIKDMGTGSYEAAQFLNSLPDAKNLNVWSDKTGVCFFFKGSCYTGFNIPKTVDINYAVLSSGRESRSEKMSRSKKHDIYDFSLYYEKESPMAFKLEIDGRPEQYVKIVDINKIQQ